VAPLLASEWEISCLCRLLNWLKHLATRSDDLNEIRNWYKHHLQTRQRSSLAVYHEKRLERKGYTGLLTSGRSDNTGVQEAATTALALTGLVNVKLIAGSHSTDLSILMNITPGGCVACHLSFARPSCSQRSAVRYLFTTIIHFTRNNRSLLISAWYKTQLIN